MWLIVFAARASSFCIHKRPFAPDFNGTSCPGGHALHEPKANEPTPGPSQEGNPPPRAAPLQGGAGGGLMVPVHARRRKGLSMNRRWFAVPHSGGLTGPDRLKPGLQTERGSWSQCIRNNERKLSQRG